MFGGNLAFQFRVPGAIALTHTASTDQRDDLVASDLASVFICSPGLYAAARQKNSEGRLHV
jgi:hypothetical protein